MKLVEIKNIKPNQIYKHKNGNIYIVSYQTHYRYKIADCFKNNILDSEENEFYSREFEEDMKIIGFLNITHKIEDNKLVEIPRKEFEVDDVIEAIQDIDYEMCYEECNIKKGEKFIIADKPCHYCLIGLDNKERFEFCFSDLKDNFIKKGVIGKDYEIINDKLIIKE